MKPIVVPTRARGINNLLKKARRRSILLESADGERYVLTSVHNWEGFEVGHDADFGEEVKRTSQNKRLIKFLAERREHTEGPYKSLEEIEQELSQA
jgi:hypothetical protein